MKSNNNRQESTLILAQPREPNIMLTVNGDAGHNGHRSDNPFETFASERTELVQARTSDDPSINTDSPGHAAAQRNDEREKFPADCLPPILRRFAESIAESNKMPAVIPYTAGLAAISSALGSSIRLETSLDETVCGNLYILPVMGSGLGKSRSSAPMLKPLYDAHDKQQEVWEEQQPEDQAELDEIENDISQIKGELKFATEAGRKEIKDRLKKLYKQKEEIEESVKPNLYTGNTTEPALAKLLRDNNEMISGVASEAGTAIQILAGKYSNKARKGDIVTEDTLLLSAFCQERYKADRSSRDSTSIELKGPTVSLYWMFQPRFIPMLFGNQSLATGGFLARCLAFDSQAEPQEETGNEPPISAKARQEYEELVGGLFSAYRLKPGAHLVKTSPKVRAIFREYRNTCVRLAKGDLRDIQQFPLRWCENAQKIALVLHCAAFGDEAHNHQIRECTAEQAIRIMRWFSDEFLALMNGGREDQAEEEANWLVQYIAKKGEVFIPGQEKSLAVRDICRNRHVKGEDVRKLVGSNPKLLKIEFHAPTGGGTNSERVFVRR